MGNSAFPRSPKEVDFPMQIIDDSMLVEVELELVIYIFSSVQRLIDLLVVAMLISYRRIGLQSSHPKPEERGNPANVSCRITITGIWVD